MRTFRVSLLALLVCSLIFTRTSTNVTATKSLPDSPTVEVTRSAEASAPQDIPQPIKDLINQAFRAVTNITIPFANQVNQWLAQATAAAQKTASDFTSCPSPAAQTLYNDLETKGNQLRQIIDAATQADAQARTALATCRATVPSIPIDFRPQCNLAYNGLPFAATRVSAQAALAAVNTALTSLRNLRCISGCNKSGKLVFPTVKFEPGGTINLTQTAQAYIDLSQTTTPPNLFPVPRQTNGRVDMRICTGWDLGSFGVNLDAVGSLDPSKIVGFEAPHCSRTERVSVCTNWDMSVLLPKLKELRIVPPGVQLPDVTVSIPQRTLRVPSGVAPSSCSSPAEICTGASGTLNFNVSLTNPLDFFADLTSCTQTTTIGCKSPPFGVTPTYSSFNVPDLTRATIRWRAARITSAGEATFDLTRTEFNLACANRDLSVPLPPRVSVGAQLVNLPYICVEPRLVNLVANP